METPFPAGQSVACLSVRCALRAASGGVSVGDGAIFLEHQFLVAESVFADVDKRVEFGRIADGVSGSEGDEADNVVTGFELAGDGAFQSGHGCLQNRQSGVSGGAVDAGEGIGVRVKALAEVAKQHRVSFLHLVQDDSGAGCQPVDEPAGFIDGHGDLGRVEGGLLDPACQQTGLLSVWSGDCQNKNTAGDSSEDLSEQRDFGSGFRGFRSHDGGSGAEYSGLRFDRGVTVFW